MKKRIPFLLLIILLLSVYAFSQQRGFKVVRTHQGKEIALYKGSYALVVGNGKYTAGWDELLGAVKDAEGVADVLGRNGFKVTLVKNADKGTFLSELSNFTYKYGQDEDNQLLFYYAGHGHTIPLASGEELGYLVMIDTPVQEKDPQGFDIKSVDMQAIITYAKKIKSKHVLFMFDCCFSGTILNLRERVTPKAISDAVQYPVRQFITAGRADEPVPDRSIFKQIFLDLLEGRRSEPIKDGYLTGEELGLYLKNTVPEYYRFQHPQYGKIRDPNLDMGDFVFVLDKVEISEAKEAQLPPEPPKTTGIDLTSIEKAGGERTRIKKQWQGWQTKMQSDFNKVEMIDKSLDYTNQEKEKAWLQFLDNYKADNSYSNEDEKLRKYAKKRIQYWKKLEEQFTPSIYQINQPLYKPSNYTGIRLPFNFKKLSKINIKSLIKQQGTLIPRFPDINKNLVVFVFAGDIWSITIDDIKPFTSKIKTNIATRLTSHIGLELFPKISPDGKWIAFTAEYTGFPQVYIMPSKGGKPIQLTFYHDSACIPPENDFEYVVLDWSPDSKKILVRAHRSPWGPGIGKYLLVNIEGGLEVPLQIPYDGLASFSNDGNKIIYSPSLKVFRNIKGYRRGRIQIFLTYDFQYSKTHLSENPQISENFKGNYFPIWWEDKHYFLSGRDKNSILNLYSFDTNIKKTTKLTDFKLWDCMWLSGSNGKVVFENGPYICQTNLSREYTVEFRIQINYEDRLLKDLDYSFNKCKNVGLLGAELKADSRSKRYMFSKIYKGNNFNIFSPLRTKGIQIKEGDYLISLNGHDITTNDNPYKYLVDTVGKEIKLVVNSKPTRRNSKMYLIKPIKSELKLKYFDWIESQSQMVQRFSNGRIGYIHLSDIFNLKRGELINCFSDFLNKEALIIDNRYNLGRQLPEDLDMVLTATGQKLILINQYCSNLGEALSYYFRVKKIGMIIGTRTSGDFNRINIPKFSNGILYDIYNSYIKDKAASNGGGIEPDIYVSNIPENLLKGVDEVLEKGIEVLLQQLKKIK